MRAFRPHDLESLDQLYEAYLNEPEVMRNQDYISRSFTQDRSLAAEAGRKGGRRTQKAPKTPAEV